MNIKNRYSRWDTEHNLIIKNSEKAVGYCKQQQATAGITSEQMFDCITDNDYKSGKGQHDSHALNARTAHTTATHKHDGSGVR